MNTLEQSLAQQLEQKRQLSLYRSHKVLQSPQGIMPIIDGKQVLSFNSNDYLGLANHPALKKAFIDAASQCGVGSGSAHLVCGHHHYHQQLEEQLAAKTGYPRALLFSTGYMANLAIGSLLSRHDTLFQDKLNHASLIDSGTLSMAKVKRYRHLDVEQCEAQLKQAEQHKLVMTDSVFSMDGDQADLGQLSQICLNHNATLMIDDAHGFGVLGHTGAGSCESNNLSVKQVPIYMATLGKAMGSFGAFVASSDTIIEALIHLARPYVYTTAMPAAQAAASLAALNVLNDEAWRRDALNRNIEYFRRCAEHCGLPLMDSTTAIQPIVLGDNHLALNASQECWDKGFLVSAIRPPTVPKGSARLRITLSAEHTHQHIDQLVNALKTIIQ